MDTAPAPAKKEAKKEESSSSGSEEESDEEEESAGKRKKSPAAEVPAKKQKVEEPAGPVSLFVGNLAEGLSEKKLQKFFEKHEVKVAEIRMHGSKPIAFVDVENAEEAKKATALNGEEFKGSALKIEISEKKGTGTDVNQNSDKPPTLFIKNLSYSCTEDNIKEMFPGSTSLRMPLGDDGYSPKGFAFLEFATIEEVNKAIEEKQGADICGRAIFLDVGGQKPQTPARGAGGRASFGGQREKSAPSQILFVKNLSWDTDGHSLQAAFATATTARVATDRETGSSRGFGFVEFESVADAQAAHDSMVGKSVDGREVTLDFAQPKGETPNRGGGAGGGGGCFKCGEEGHFSRECPSGGGGGGGITCFKCNEQGHMSRECPKGGSSSACFKCGEEGHMSRECPSGGGGRGGGRGGGGGGGGGCFKCGEDGHFSRECPSGGGGGFGGRGGGRGRGGDRGRGRGGDRGRGRGGRGGSTPKRDGIKEFTGTKKSFDD